MRAAFGLLAMVVVMGIVLTLAKKQSQALTAPLPAASGAETAAPSPRPEAVGRQVQDAVDAAAQRASAAAP